MYIAPLVSLLRSLGLVSNRRSYKHSAPTELTFGCGSAALRDYGFVCCRSFSFSWREISR